MQEDPHFHHQTQSVGRDMKEKELYFFDWVCLAQTVLGHQHKFHFRARKSQHMWCDAKKYSAHFEEQRAPASAAADAAARGGGAGGAGDRGTSDSPPFLGDATSSYVFHPSIPPMAHRAFPGAKIIALLRNPIDRAYSGYVTLNDV